MLNYSIDKYAWIAYYERVGWGKNAQMNSRIEPLFLPPRQRNKKEKKS